MIPFLDELASRLLQKRLYRGIIPVAFIAMHLGLFVAGAHSLGMPFNRAPGNPPVFTNILASQTTDSPREPHRWARLAVSRFDAEHYQSVALRGFAACPKAPATPQNLRKFNACGIPWLPGYGLVGLVVARLVPFGIGIDYVLLGVSMISSFWLMFLWTSPVLVRRFGALESIGGLIALNVFPSGFYLVAVYAEAITLAFCLAGLVAMCKDRWLLSAFLIGTATAFRPTAVGFGLAFGLAAVFHAHRKWKAREPRWWRVLLFTPLTGWGLGATMLFYFVEFRDALLFNHSRALFGDRPSFVRLLNPGLYVNGFASREYDMVVLAGMVVLLAVGAWPALRRCRAEERAYLVVGTAVCIVMALANATNRWGLNRYFLLAILVFFAGGQLIKRAPALFVAWIIFCIPMYWHVALCNYISHGQPRMCPLVGPRDGIEQPMDG